RCAHDESIRLARISARGSSQRRRTVDGRNVPSWLDREDPRTSDRAGLSPTLTRAGRLPPEQMYPAGERDIAVRWVDAARGLKLRTLESGDSTGAAVLLVHGWGANVYSWAETIPAIAAAGYRVIALDLPGHGWSDKPVTEEQY